MTIKMQITHKYENDKKVIIKFYLLALKLKFICTNGSIDINQY